MKAVRLGLTSFITAVFLASPVWAHEASPHGESPDAYRALTLRVRKSGEFMVPVPTGPTDMTISYKLDWGDPIFKAPLKSDIHNLGWNSSGFYSLFWDKIFLKENSTINIAGEELPLTCVYVSGQDNRNSNNESPLLPQYVIKVYLVAKDFSCEGPMNRGWPENGLRQESWDTYLYYEIRDPTIMLPTEVRVRYRWNEFNAVIIDRPEGVTAP